jgi:hypothetical protein
MCMSDDDGGREVAEAFWPGAYCTGPVYQSVIRPYKQVGTAYISIAI